MICEICNDGKDYKNLGAHKFVKHNMTATGGMISDEEEPKEQIGSVTTPFFPEENKENTETSLLQGIIGLLKKIDSRITDLEVKAGGKDNSFKKAIKEEDRERAGITRKNVDEKIVKMVDEILGEDFGIDVEPRQDQPGFLFTLIVPRRLSDLAKQTHPIKGEDGQYRKDPVTQNAIEEDYYPEDRRSRAISSYQSYDSIREHCERVRSYIVSYYQKMSRPIPEFKLKSY